MRNLKEEIRKKNDQIASLGKQIADSEVLLDENKLEESEVNKNSLNIFSNYIVFQFML